MAIYFKVRLFYDNLSILFIVVIGGVCGVGGGAWGLSSVPDPAGGAYTYAPPDLLAAPLQELPAQSLDTRPRYNLLTRPHRLSPLNLKVKLRL